jgi:5-methyltetrahydrofolate--homocysteine methyltransferase
MTTVTGTAGIGGHGMTEALVTAIAEMEDEQAIRLATSMIEGGTSPLDILEACKAGMAIVGDRFEKGEYFVPELILAGEMLKQISEIVKPHLSQEGDAPKLGTVVLGTVAGDIHDIGKDIVHFMLEVNGFEVRDLGVDVPVATFVEAVREDRPEVVALSGFLTLSYDAMRDTVTALTEAGLRNDVKIMIGGGTVDDQVRVFAGADAFGLNAMDAVNLAKGWLQAGVA